MELVLNHPCSKPSSSPGNCGYSCYIDTFKLSTTGLRTGPAAIFPRVRDRLQGVESMLQVCSSGYRVTEDGDNS